MSLSALFFDAVGTLFHVRGSVGGIYAEVARRYGVEVSPEILSREFREAMAKGRGPDYTHHPRESWDQAEKDWWAFLVSRVFLASGRPPEPFDDYFDEVYRAFEDPGRWELYPDVQDTLRTLKDRGLILGIISNFDRRIFPLCRGLGLMEWIDSVHLPRDVGAQKPDPRLFQAALSFHRLLPHQAVHVGDHPVEDEAGARGAGLRALRIDRHGVPTEGVVGVLRRLDELIGHIDGG